jgi:hypothetical protein
VLHDIDCAFKCKNPTANLEYTQKCLQTDTTLKKLSMPYILAKKGHITQFAMAAMPAQKPGHKYNENVKGR